jgi:hypothetical protein
MKIKLISALFFLLPFTVFAQTDILSRLQGPPLVISDYYFVAEKPGADDSAVPVLSAFLAALVSDADTVSFITYAEKPLIVCPPLEGNTPDFPQLIMDRLNAVPAAKAVSETALAAAVNLADEQAAVNARPEAVRRLLVFSGARTAAAGIAPPKNFNGGVFYVSLDSPPEQALAAIAGPGRFWHFGIKQPPAGEAAAPEDPVNFADGFAALISAVNGGYGVGQKDAQAFTLGAFFKTVRGAVILVENANSLSLSKDNKAVQEARLIPAGQYGIIKLNNAPAGNYTVAGADVVQVMEWTGLSPAIFAAGGLAIAAVLLILLVAVIAAAGRAKEQRRTVFKVICEVNNNNPGFPEPEICMKKNPKYPLKFESGSSIRAIVMTGMRGEIEETKLSPVVKDNSPFIEFDKQRKQWILKYDISTAEREEEQDTPADDGPDLFGRNKTPVETERTSEETAEFNVDEEYIIDKAKFEAPCIFMDRNYKLFLMRQ